MVAIHPIYCEKCDRKIKDYGYYEGLCKECRLKEKTE